MKKIKEKEYVFIDDKWPKKIEHLEDYGLPYEWSNEKGWTLYLDGKYDKAIDAFNQSIEFLKQNGYTIDKWEYLERNNQSKILPGYVKRGYQGLKEALYKKGLVLMKKNEFNETEQKNKYNELMKKDDLPQDVKNDFERAIDCFTKVIKLDKKDWQPYFDKAECLYHLKRYDEGAFVLNICIDVADEGNWPLLYCNRGFLMTMFDGKEKEAMECFDKCIELEPNYYLAHHNKGCLFVYWKRYEEAIKCFDKCIELNKTFMDAYLYKGKALTALGKVKEACETMSLIFFKFNNKLKENRTKSQTKLIS